MQRISRFRVPLVVLGVLAVGWGAGLTVPAAVAAAVDADLALVVQMPLAVARVAEVGYPEDDLALLAAGLVDAGVAPEEFVAVVRLAPVEWRLVEVTPFYAGDRAPDYDLARRIRSEEAERWRFVDRPEPVGLPLGAFVQARLAEGLRGPELAAAIHRELRLRGVPAGPKRWARPAEREFVVRVFETERVRQNVERRATGWLPPGQAKKAGRGLPPGQAKKLEGGVPPGQTRKVNGGVPPGQAKKGRALPPGQAKKAAPGRGEKKVKDRPPGRASDRGGPPAGARGKGPKGPKQGGEAKKPETAGGKKGGGGGPRPHGGIWR